MSVAKENLVHASRLAKLDLTGGLSGAEAQQRLDVFVGQLQDMASSLDILSEIDPGDTEPLYALGTRVAGPRADTARQEFTREDMFKNAPGQQHEFFVVPRILGNG